MSRAPSYPDRARIDSDVRAFLRPVSTPWIVFDRDSRVDDFALSALRRGAVFASTPSFRPEVIQAAQESGKSVEEIAAMPIPGLEPLEPSVAESSPPPAPNDAFQPGGVLSPAMSSVLPDGGVFPATFPESTVEPSNLVVASDVMPESAPVEAAEASIESSSDKLSSKGTNRRRVVSLFAACVLVSAAGAAVALSGVVKGKAAAETALAEAPVESPAPAAPALAAPPPSTEANIDEIDIPEPPPPAPVEVEVAVEPVVVKAPTDPKKRFGKLTIRGGAKNKNVWFNGKRLLGSGSRSFTVFCGMHTIAVSDKTDARDVEVPCNGEYVVSR